MPIPTRSALHCIVHVCMCACALQVRPESVKFVLKWSYAAHLTLLCLVDDAFTRLWVLGSTMLTCAAYHPWGGGQPPSGLRLSAHPLLLHANVLAFFSSAGAAAYPPPPAAGRHPSTLVGTSTRCTSSR